MNRLASPNVDDEAAFQAIAANRQLKSYPHLRAILPDVLQGYQGYRAAGGDLERAPGINLTELQKNFLLGHYSSPPVALSHIAQLREARDYKCCSMCGSLHCGTLDHILPKEQYPHYAIFSANLVPACKCNQMRGRVTFGRESGERILHPYFDDCLSERLIVAEFLDLGLVPSVRLKIAVAQDHEKYRAIRFHLESVVQKTQILRYLADRWSKFCRRPQAIVRLFAEPVLSRDQLKLGLEQELGNLDYEHESKNNWESVFVAGLLQDEVLHWLFDILSQDGRVPGQPLLNVI